MTSGSSAEPEEQNDPVAARSFPRRSPNQASKKKKGLRSLNRNPFNSFYFLLVDPTGIEPVTF